MLRVGVVSSSGNVSLLDRVVDRLDSLDGKSALGHTHVLGKGGVGNPACRLARRGLLHHPVDLLEGKALGLPNEEVGVNEAAHAKGAPDEENLGLEVGLVGTNHIGGNDGNDAIPQPVGSGRKSDSSRPDGDREDLPNNHPGSGAPRCGKECDIYANKTVHVTSVCVRGFT
jgi:hypothetical protein